VEITHGTICGSAAQRPLPLREQDREHEARPRSDAPFAVCLDEKVPAVGAEFEVVVSDVAGLRAATRVVEPKFAAPE
jgi:hypothetical protein